MPISAAVRRGRLFRRRSPITWRTSPGTRPRLDSAQLAPHARSSRATRAATPARPAATLAVDDAPEERARVGPTRPPSEALHGVVVEVDDGRVELVLA